MSISKVEINVSCRKLPKRDTLSQSDAFCVLHSVPNDILHTAAGGSKQSKAPPPRVPATNQTEVGRTETVYDTKNPDFTTPFVVDYHFEQEQTFVLRVFDEDKKGDRNLASHDYLGGTVFTLGQLMGAQGNSLARPLGQKKGNKGYIILHAEEISESREYMELQLSGQDLKNKDGMFGTSDPFLAIKRLNRDGQTWNVVYKSNVVMNNLNPTWSKSRIPLQTLCNGDVDRPIQIQILDWDKDGSHDDMGCVETTVADLVKGKVFDVLRKSKSKMRMPGSPKKLKKSGTITVKEASVRQDPTMLEYISGGCQIHLMVAVDFTASNGHPTNPSSLHHTAVLTHEGKQWNQYQSAILKIGTILQDYATVKQFVMWGFGASIDGVAQPCFEMGGGEQGQKVEGVQGLMDAYLETFQTPGFRLSGPTNFVPVLQPAMARAIELASSDQQKNHQCYSVLAILTDGAITDMKDTINLICQAADEAPLSIVIIGVGNADFSRMEELDGDEGRIRNSKGIPASRDIVQFVPYNKFAGDATRLAAETLKEIPNQCVEYFVSNGIQPNPPLPTPEFDEDEIFVSWNEQDEDIVVE